MKKRSSGVAFICRKRILLSHHTRASWFGTYSIVKGEIEGTENITAREQIQGNETLMQAAVREFKEETGHELDDLLKQKIEYAFESQETSIVVENAAKILTAAIVFLDGTEEIGILPPNIKYPKHQLQADEVDWVGFVDFEEARTRMAPYQLPILEKAIQLGEGYSPNPLPIKNNQTTMTPANPENQKSTDLSKIISDNGKHVPYLPVSDICNENLGTVVPKGMVSEMMLALETVKAKLQEKYGWDLDDYVQDRLQYTPEELGIDRKLYDSASPDQKKKMINAKLCSSTGGPFAGEQMDALALAIFNIEASSSGDGYGMIVGDMTGIGKGRIAAGLIRYCIKFHKKVPIFITEKAYLFSDIYRDLSDIKSDPMVPLIFRAPDLDYEKQVKMSQSEIAAAIQERLELGETEDEAREMVETMVNKGTTTVLGYRINTNYSKQERALSKHLMRIRPYILNAKKDESKIKDDAGNIIYEPLQADKQREIVERKKLPADYNLIMLTYSQINRAGTSKKMAFLKQMAENTIIICDESHVASGISNTGEFTFNLLSKAMGAAFLSATYSKRPDNMVVYAAKTSIREAELSKEDLVAAIQMGGVPLQEIISSQLVAEGQMVRRERSYAGIDVKWNVMDDSMTTGHPEFDLKDKHTAIANMFTEILRDIIDLQATEIKPWLKELSPADFEEITELMPGSRIVIERNQDISKLLTSSPMFSRVFNIVNQLLFSIKAEAIAERAINYMRSGKKPVVAFSNTMGAFLENMRNEDGQPLANGDVIDTDFRLVLEKLLNVLLVLTVKDPQGGGSTKVTIPKSMLPDSARMRFNAILHKIKQISIGISISPIDVLIYKIKEAGFTVEEVTGRKSFIRFSDNSFLTGTFETRQRPATTDTFRGFNENRIDCLLINQSGAVGASFHASPNKVVNHVRWKDEKGDIVSGPYMKGMKQKLIIPDSLEPRNEIKQRAMLMLQSELNINTEVQKRGRIFRSGQVLPPMYEYLCSAIPAEQRLQMMMQKKLHSLDANTSSNQKSSDELVNVVDFLNVYGDELVVEYLFNNAQEMSAVNTSQSLIRKLGDPFDMIQDDGSVKMPVKTPPDAAHRITGRVAVLSVSDQEKFYKDITQKYIDKIKLLDAVGKYTGAVKILDLQAITLDRQIFQVGSGGSSLFGRNTILELCEVNNLRKPYTQEELNTYLQEGHEEFYGLRNAGIKQQQQLLDDQKSFYEEKKRTLDEKFAVKLERAIERIKDDSQYKKIAKKSPEEADKLMKLHIAAATEKNNTDRLEEKDIAATQYEVVRNLLKRIYVGMVTKYQAGLLRVPAVITKVDVDRFRSNPWAPSAIYVRVAVANGIRNFYCPLSNTETINMLIANSAIGNEAERVLDNWDEITKESMTDRVKRYIVTGNLLQAMGDPAVAENTGQLLKFTQVRNGKIILRNGVLLGPEFDPIKHTGGRGSTFVLVPAKKCWPIISRLEHNAKENKQALYETNNQIQFERAQNGYDFLMRVPLDRNWKYIWNDTRLKPYLDSEKGFTNWGEITVWNPQTLKKEPNRAMGAIVKEEEMQNLLEFISNEYKSSFKISTAVFEELKTSLGIDTSSTYDDGVSIEESESGLAQLQLKNYNYDVAKEAVIEQTSGLEQPKNPVPLEAQPIIIEPVVETVDTVSLELEKQALINQEREAFDYERSLFKLQKLLMGAGIFADGGSLNDDNEVASIIIDQLGGIKRLRLFTGLLSANPINNGVELKMPLDAADNPYQKADTVKITLNSMDTYDVVFYKNSEQVSEYLGVYDDMLVDIFETGTGLFLSFS